MEKINWGTVLVDMTILIVAGFTQVWPLIILLFFTGGYKLNEKSITKNN